MAIMTTFNSTERGATQIINNQEASFIAAQIYNGHFAQGFELIGGVMMAASSDFHDAGITFDDIRQAIFGAKGLFDLSMMDMFNADYPEFNGDYIAYLNGTSPDIIFTNYDTYNRQLMQNARQAITYKFMDHQVELLLKDSGIKIMPGFAKALVGGYYEYFDLTGKKITLKGDAARLKYATDFMTMYAYKNIKIFKDFGLSEPLLNTLVEFGLHHAGDSAWLQSQLGGPDGTGTKALGGVVDNIFKKTFGITMASGTGTAIINYAFSSNISSLGKDLWSAWQFQAFNWADKALGLKSGTAQTLYQGIVAYQQAISTYRSTVALVSAITNDASATYTIIKNGKEVAATATEAKQYALNKANNQFKTSTAMIIASVANVVFQKEIGQIETALGLAPGTLMYLVQYLIHPDPISLGLFIFFNFIWGKSKTTCAIDHYPGESAYSPAAQYLSDALTYTQYNGNVDLSASDISASKKAGANPIMKQLTTPGNFNGQDNNSYRKGIKAGAQYEVKLVIGSLISMNAVTKNTTQPVDLPIQIGTYSIEDINLFEPLSAQDGVYGSIGSRGKKGPGFYDKMSDRIHVGY